MISPFRFKGRRVAELVRLGAACLMLIVICSLFCDGLDCVVGRLPRVTGHCLAPDGLNSRAPMPACPHHLGETSATIWGGVGSRHIIPSPPEHRVTDRIWPRPPPRAITRQRTRCQSYGRDEGGGASSHVPIRSEPNGPPSTAGRPRWAAVPRERAYAGAGTSR